MKYFCKNYTLFAILCVFVLALFVTGCTKDKETSSDIPKPTGNKTGKLNIRIQHLVDGLLLQTDTMRYTNAAGYRYSVSKLQYYIDSVTLLSGNTFVVLNKTYYVDAAFNTPSFLFDSIPAGQYTGIRFLIGLRPRLNQTNQLPTNPENLGMAWPDHMGGGYHFLKLEGHYLDTNGQINGYTLHLGTQEMLVAHQTIPLSLQITEAQSTSLKLNMNINEWFVHPNTYDFTISGNHIMGNDSSMQKIRDNGKDVFSN